MELRIEKLTFPEVINFNFEELRNEITKVTANYAGLVYDESQIKDAKRDVANLRKFTKALSDERIRVKKEILKPYEDFERKINELSGIVDNAIRNIDSQIKGAEEKRKAEKLEAIKEIWRKGIPGAEEADWLTLERIFDEKWLNASVSLKAVYDAIAARVAQITTDLATLRNLPEFGFEAAEVYKSTLNLNTALNEGKRLAEIQKRKIEAEARAKAEAEATAQMEAAIRPVPEGFMNPPEPEEKKPEMEWLAFRALMTTKEAQELRKFFQMHDIRFEPI